VTITSWWPIVETKTERYSGYRLTG